MGIVEKETSKKLLQIKKLTLKLCIDTCRAYEASTAQISAIPDTVTVHRVRNSKPKPAQKNKQYKPNVMKCHFCGKQHGMLKSKCPAYGKTCKACKQKKNSCSAKCHKKVNSVTNSNDDIHMINIVHYISDKALFEKIIMNNKSVKIQIDSGASENVLPEQYVSPVDIQQLQLFSRCIINLLLNLWVKVKVYNPANGHTYSVKFVIVPKNVGLIPILGSKASQFMNIMTLNKNNLEPVLQLKLSNVIDD